MMKSRFDLELFFETFMPDYLFSTEEFSDYIQQRTREVAGMVAGFGAEEILQRPAEDLADVVVGHCTIKLPVLDRTREKLDEPEEVMMEVNDYGTLITVPAFRLTLIIPFTGEGRYFRFRPNAFTSAPPIANILPGKMVLNFVERGELDGTRLRNAFEKVIAEIEQYLGWQRTQVMPFNDSIRPNALKAIAERKKKLLAARSVAASIGYNMRPVLAVPTTHRAVQIQRKPTPVAAKSGFKSEPELMEDDYQHILGIIEAMSHVFERSPETFATLGEEDLRLHLMVPLNGHYKGEGTAEAFNNKGKTDILIRVEDKNIFIAECKVWGGDKVCKEAIDQLLGYLTWRDTKTCLIMFSHLKDFSYMLKEFWKSIEGHPNFKRTEKEKAHHESRRRYVFRNAYDADRELILTGLAFNIPKP